MHFQELKCSIKKSSHLIGLLLPENIRSGRLDPCTFEVSQECPRRELNPRPHPYQGCALPLSYKGIIKVGRVGPDKIACSTAILKCVE